MNLRNKYILFYVLGLLSVFVPIVLMPASLRKDVKTYAIIFIIWLVLRIYINYWYGKKLNLTNITHFWSSLFVDIGFLFMLGFDRQLLPALNIFKEALTIFKVNYKTFLKVLSWLLIPALLLIILNIFDSLTNLKFVNYSFPIYLLLSALSFIIGLWTQIVLIRLTSASLTKEALNEKILYTESWRDTAPFLWISILMSLIIMAGTILLVIPGLIFTIWYLFSLYIFAIEGKRGYGALQRSKELVQGRFWAVVWRLVVTSFFYGIIVFVIIAIPTLIIGLFTKFDQFSSVFSSMPWWLNALQSVVAILTLPLNIGLMTVMFKNLKDNAPAPESTSTNLN